MSRSVPGSIVTQLAGTHLKLARCVKIITRDGTVFAFTDLDEDVVVPTNLLTGAEATYAAGRGVMPTDLSLSAGLDSGNTEIIIPIGVVSKADVIGKRFSQAKVWIFDIDHSAEFPEPMPLMFGRITESRLEEARAIFEVRDLNDVWNITIGSVLTPRCRADYGDEKCGVVVESTIGIVEAVTTAMEIRLSIGGLYADQYFRYGEIEFTSGPLAGSPPREIVSFTGSTGEIELFDPLPTLPQVGDDFRIRRGCSRLKSSSDPTIPTCLTNNNVTRFRGFDRVPGSDTYLKIAAPGSGGA